MPNLPLYTLTFLTYGVLAIFFWRAQVEGKGEVSNHGWLGNAILIPLVLHGYLLSTSLWVGGALSMGLVNALSLIFWLAPKVP